MDYSVGNGKMYVLVNESSGEVCHLAPHTGPIIGTRSACYKAKKGLSMRFPSQRYAVYKLIRLGRMKREA